MNNTFYTSDTHFNHDNIITYSKRPFSNVEEMNEVLVNNWNNIVSPKDTVYHFGDVFMKDYKAESILNRLNGQICLIKGNHEKTALKYKGRFTWVKDYYELTNIVDEQISGIVMFHYPIASWNKQHHNYIHLHGHCHNTHEPWKKTHMPEAKSFDVGVDSVANYLGNGILLKENYRPLSFAEVKKIMSSRKGKINLDHHR